jgi:hypothetical protein
MHSGGNLFAVKQEFIGISKAALVCWQIPNHVAVKIALELKKLLIDNSLLDVYALNLLTLSSHHRIFLPCILIITWF